ncbi:MAG: stage 0 sporulation family protein [Chloroflexi bacterium]|nr:stage 0 sporulation family protein [Chloroflexota bacterium]
MTDIVGIRFKRAGRVYYFDPAGLELDINDDVVVETSRGLEMGQVVIAPRQVVNNDIVEPLKPVIRKAEAEDKERAAQFRCKQCSAMKKCAEMIAEARLPMKLISAEYNLDGTRLTFYFSSEGRVDFRELVRRLTSAFDTRVELRQVGPRDEAKMVGGFGRCGRPLCCASHLSSFSTVSIRMAKEQDLPLNPAKISGVCGRLLCCLAHESEQYRMMKEKMPPIGQKVRVPMGEGTIVGTNPLKDSAEVELESGATVEAKVSELTLAEGTAPVGRKDRRNRRRR